MVAEGDQAPVGQRLEVHRGGRHPERFRLEDKKRGYARLVDFRSRGGDRRHLAAGDHRRREQSRREQSLDGQPA